MREMTTQRWVGGNQEPMETAIIFSLTSVKSLHTRMGAVPIYNIWYMDTYMIHVYHYLPRESTLLLNPANK